MVIHLHSLLQYILFRPKPVCAEKCKFRNVIQDIEYQPFFFNTFLYYFWHFWCNVSSEGYISQRCVWDIFCVQKGSYVDEDREMLRGHLTLRNSYLLKPAIIYCTFYGVFNSEQSYFYMLVFVSTNVLQRSRKVNLVLALWRSGS